MSGGEKMCLKDEGPSNKERVELLPGLKADLEKEGFRVSWRNPFFEEDGRVSDVPPFAEGTRFYVSGLTVPRIAPFDVVTALISVEQDFLYFSLCFYFRDVLEPAIEAEEIEEIYDRHDGSWFPSLADYFQELQESFSLKWDVEYDSCIEDSLYGRFPLDSPGVIISLMRALRGMHEGDPASGIAAASHQRQAASLR
jgi:hypothetical protein